jgi:glyoxylase-like metal-dependent hydrolase (beta-lactamase superfamily II)
VSRTTGERIARDVHAYAPGPLAGNVYLVGTADAWALIDTGMPKQGERIQGVAAALFGPSARPAAILLTHVHPDHAGSALELARAWQVPVYLHPAEMDLATARDLATVTRYATPLDRAIVLPVMRLMPRRRVEAMIQADSLEGWARPLPPDGDVPGLPGWTSLATPGHSPGHVAFHRKEDGVLITGDALLTVNLGSLAGFVQALLRRGPARLCDPPRYLDLDHAAAVASAAALVRLRPRVLAPGHGRPLAGAELDAQLRTHAGAHGST